MLYRSRTFQNQNDTSTTGNKYEHSAFRYQRNLLFFDPDLAMLRRPKIGTKLANNIGLPVTALWFFRLHDKRYFEQIVRPLVAEESNTVLELIDNNFTCNRCHRQYKDKEFEIFAVKDKDKKVAFLCKHCKRIQTRSSLS
mmetsp:Transcript_36213/g.57948  ORF Transcript_36213/g.57948 Transcript_36213/m.57948 type:complete len:140 (-) Transcript_36213:46-465(-)